MIIVFYSGHGSTYSSNGFHFEKDEGKHIDLKGLQETLRPEGPVIDAIVPIDRDEEDRDPDYVGTKVPDICDRELNAIFNLTRRKKGPNIVFIADCCYSASISRNADALWKERALPPFGGDLLREMLSRGQRNIDKWSNGPQTNITDPDWTPDQSGFVMLAACLRDQTAREFASQGHGLFTGVLLDTLNPESNEVGEDTTFEGAIKLVAEKMRPFWQEPIAHGDRKHCRLWFL